MVCRGLWLIVEGCGLVVEGLGLVLWSGCRGFGAGVVVLSLIHI